MPARERWSRENPGTLWGLCCTRVAGGGGEGCGFSYLLELHMTYLAGSHVLRSWPGIRLRKHGHEAPHFQTHVLSKQTEPCVRACPARFGFVDAKRSSHGAHPDLPNIPQVSHIFIHGTTLCCWAEIYSHRTHLYLEQDTPLGRTVAPPVLLFLGHGHQNCEPAPYCTPYTSVFRFSLLVLHTLHPHSIFGFLDISALVLAVADL
jgi:hypothetical protein